MNDKVHLPQEALFYLMYTESTTQRVKQNEETGIFYKEQNRIKPQGEKNPNETEINNFPGKENLTEH